MCKTGGKTVIVKGKGIVNTGRTMLRLLSCSATASSTEYVRIIVDTRWDVLAAIAECAKTLDAVEKGHSFWTTLAQAQEWVICRGSAQKSKHTHKPQNNQILAFLSISKVHL